VSTTVWCKVVGLRALVALQSAQLIINLPVVNQ
jgi:hypothetical protein